MTELCYVVHRFRNSAGSTQWVLNARQIFYVPVVALVELLRLAIQTQVHIIYQLCKATVDIG